MWKPVKDGLPKRPHPLILVTNNIEARNAHGHHSHVWLARLIFENGDGNKSEYGSFYAYKKGSCIVISHVTHWRYAVLEDSPD